MKAATSNPRLATSSRGLFFSGRLECTLAILEGGSAP